MLSLLHRLLKKLMTIMTYKVAISEVSSVSLTIKLMI